RSRATRERKLARHRRREVDGSRVRLGDSGHDGNERRLPGTVATNQPMDRRFLDVDADAAQGGRGPEPLPDLGHPNDRFGRAHWQAEVRRRWQRFRLPLATTYAVARGRPRPGPATPATSSAIRRPPSNPSSSNQALTADASESSEVGQVV